MNSTTVSIVCALIALCGVLLNLFMPRIWSKKDKNADKLDALSQAVNRVDKKLDAHIAEDEMRDILQARRRIIDFSDECRRGTKHSEEHFNNVLSDIDTYERYCNEHPLFENRQAVSSIAFVAEVYDKCKRDNDFI